MTKKNYRIDFEYDYNFVLIGICSPLKDHHLCYNINKEIGSSFNRSDIDISIDFIDGIERAEFSLFEYFDKQYENQWYLLSNKCQILCNEVSQIKGTIFDGFIQNELKTKYLIPENSKLDYYLQVHGVFSENSKLELINNIQNINCVITAHEIRVNDLLSKENLIIK